VQLHHPESTSQTDASLVDSPAAWRRLAISLALSTLGGVGMWSVVVVLPYVQAEFGIGRSEASIPYTATMLGFAFGGVLMGRLADRFGVTAPLLLGATGLAAGYFGAALSGDVWQFTFAQGVLIGLFGCSSVFGPLVADISHWFRERRGLAVSICASGNYISGTVWPPAIRYMIDTLGWRYGYAAVGAICIRPSPRQEDTGAHTHVAAPGQIVLSPNALQALLIVAGITCCLAMAMPQVHIVAYCGDLGYGVARGAEMLSLMLGFGVLSRLGSGWIADRIGGVRTLLLGSALQCATLFLYLPFDGLISLYVVSILFGLAQGGIVPSYAIIVREFLPAREAGARVGIVLMATIIGMALGGWLSGAIYDWTGSYQAAFLNGIAWNLVNTGIAIWLLFNRPQRRQAFA
jgi:MFS family permease